MMQLYDITIAANTTRQLDAPGSYFYFYTGSAGGADSSITLRGLSSGLRITLKPGQAFRLPAGQSETSWVLTNLANVATIIGSVIVGDGDITDNRVTGSVEVIDGGKNRTAAGSAFIFSANVTAPAGVTPSAILWNPAGSGKNLFVKSMRYSQTLSALYGSQMVTSLGTGLVQQTTFIVPKRMGTASIAQGWMASSSTFNGTTAGVNSFVTATLAANSVDQVAFQEPIMVAPGTGFQIFSATQNLQIIGGLEYIEESAI